MQAIDTSYSGSVWATEKIAIISTNKAKSLSDEATLQIKGIVTAVFSDCCYVESEDRSSGIRVEASASLGVGDKVYVSGTMATSSDGERYISTAAVTPLGSGSISPVSLTNRNLGGADFNFSAGAGQRGVSGGFGLNNIGMLVRTTGKVMLVEDGYFYINDGSNVQDSVSRVVKVTCGSGILMPEQDHYVSVTGISSILKTDSRYYHNLRAIDIKQIQ